MVLITDHEYCTKLMEDLWKQVESSSESVDMILKVGDSSFPCHSFVLSIASPVLFDLLMNTSDTKDADSTSMLDCGKNIRYIGDLTKVQHDNKMNDFDHDVWLNILRFLYTGQIRIEKEKNQEIQRFAEIHQIQSLIDICKIYEEKGRVTDNESTTEESDSALVYSDPLVEMFSVPETAGQNETPVRIVEIENGKSGPVKNPIPAGGKRNISHSSLPCPHCGKLFSDPGSLISHKCSVNSRSLLSSVLDTAENEENNPFSCAFCFKPFEDYTTLTKHEKTHKCKRCNKVFDTVSRSTSHKCVKAPNRVVYECTVCGKNYKSRQCFISHQKVHKGARGVSCPYCSKKFLHRLPLQKHLLTHTNKEAGSNHICRICNTTFRLQIKLYSHCIKYEHMLEEVPYRCESCSKLFPCERELKSHERIHYPVKPFPCEECDKRYSSKLGLQFHINSVHLKKLLYTCTECDRRFAQRSHLNDHKRIHTKEQKFVCSFCGISLSTKINLTRHENLHTGARKFSCLICKKKFALFFDLRRHVKVQHCDYVCEHCGSTFNSISKLKRHMRQKHEDRNES